MSTFISALSPWLKDSIIRAVTFSTLEGDPELVPSIDDRPTKLVQLVSLNGLFTASSSLHRINVADGTHYMEVFLTLQAAEAFKANIIKMQGGGGDKIDQEARWRGSVLRLSAWNVNSVVMCSGKRFSSVARGDDDGLFDGCERPASLPLCIQAGRVEILEETGCAVGTDLEDVNKTVELRAALGGVNHLMLLKRLKAWYSFVGGAIADAGGLRGVGKVGSILHRSSTGSSDCSDSCEEDDEEGDEEGGESSEGASEEEEDESEGEDKDQDDEEEEEEGGGGGGGGGGGEEEGGNEAVTKSAMKKISDMMSDSEEEEEDEEEDEENEDNEEEDEEEEEEDDDENEEEVDAETQAPLGSSGSDQLSSEILLSNCSQPPPTPMKNDEDDNHDDDEGDEEDTEEQAPCTQGDGIADQPHTEEEDEAMTQAPESAPSSEGATQENPNEAGTLEVHSSGSETQLDQNILVDKPTSTPLTAIPEVGAKEVVKKEKEPSRKKKPKKRKADGEANKVSNGGESATTSSKKKKKKKEKKEKERDKKDKKKKKGQEKELEDRVPALPLTAKKKRKKTISKNMTAEKTASKKIVASTKSTTATAYSTSSSATTTATATTKMRTAPVSILRRKARTSSKSFNIRSWMKENVTNK